MEENKKAKRVMTQKFLDARDRLINAMVDFSVEAKEESIVAGLLAFVATQDFNAKLVDIGTMLFLTCDKVAAHGVLLPDGRCVACTPGLREQEYERVKALSERHRAGLDS